MNLLLNGASILTIEPGLGLRRLIAWRHLAGKKMNLQGWSRSCPLLLSLDLVVSEDQQAT